MTPLLARTKRMPAVRCRMKVELDTRNLPGMMSPWRNATDMKVKLSDEAKLHMLANRAQMLKNMVDVADHWRTSLQACTGAVKELSELDACRRRLNFDPPCRLNFDPGMEAGIVDAGCA